MADLNISQREPELSGARHTNRTGSEPRLGGGHAFDWSLWDLLFNSTEPPAHRVERIPKANRAVYVSALSAALPLGTTYNRPLQNGETWQGHYTDTQRLVAITLLGALRDKKAIEPLIAQLQSPSNHLRIATIIALGWIGGQKAVDALGRLLSHQHEPTRIEAARWLGWTDDRRAFQYLVSGLNDSVKSVRLAAATSLAALDDPRCFSPLLRAFWQRSGSERDELLDVLRNYDAQRTIAALIQTRAGENSPRYPIATWALRKLRTPEARATLDDG